MDDEREERRQLKRKRIISWIIIVLMVLSVVGFYVGSGDATNVQRYNGIKFTGTQQGVHATITGDDYTFNYFPLQVEGIAADPVAIDALQSPVLFISYDPDSNFSRTMAAVQYYLVDIFEARFDIFGIPAVTHNESLRLPIIGCANATRNEPVLVFRESNDTRITTDGACVTATAESEEDVLRLADKLLYMLLGVMDR